MSQNLYLVNYAQMPHLDHVPNHTTDPSTGFIESTAYPYAFDAAKKQMFLDVYRRNGLTIYGTCTQLGIKHDTFIKHYRNDQAFKQAFDQTEREYADELQGVSRLNALNPRSVIERIFQLKALFPERYGDSKSQAPTQITINVDGKLLEMVKKREQIIEGELITSNSVTELKQLDSESK